METINKEHRPEIVNAMNALDKATSVMIEDLREELLNKDNYTLWEDRQAVIINKAFDFAKDVTETSIDQLEIINKLFFDQEREGENNVVAVLALEGCLTSLKKDVRTLLALNYQNYWDIFFSAYHDILVSVRKKAS